MLFFIFHFFGLEYKIAYFPLQDLPFNIPQDFVVEGEGLFCLNTDRYDDMITIVKTNKFNLDETVKTERKHCQSKKDNLKKQFKAKENSLLDKIEKLEKKIKVKDAKHKSLEDKMFWVQIGSGAAIIAISGFAIYSSQK